VSAVSLVFILTTHISKNTCNLYLQEKFLNRLADKDKKLNVNVVMGVQNLIAVVISSVSKLSHVF